MAKDKELDEWIEMEQEKQEWQDIMHEHKKLKIQVRSELSYNELIEKNKELEDWLQNQQNRMDDMKN